jgi:GNAT superfamily N-acetyltransferase
VLNELLLPTVLETRRGPMTLRRASAADLDDLMSLLADDPISASRGDVAADADRPRYLSALQAIIDDPGNDLLIAEDAQARAVATFQLTRIPGMARLGATRITVEAVRVRHDARSEGIGGVLMRWVTEVAAPALGAGLVQLTSDAARVDAHRFYEHLGFVASHLGFKYQVADR